MGGFFGSSGGGSSGSTDQTGNPIPTGDTSGLGAGFTPNTTGVDTSGGVPGFDPGADLSNIASSLINPSFGLQTAMGQSAFANNNPPGVDPSQFGGGQQQAGGGPVTSFQGNQSAEQSLFHDNEAIQAIVNALRKDPNRGIPETPSWFRPSDRSFPSGGGFGTEGTQKSQGDLPSIQSIGNLPSIQFTQPHERQTDPLSGSQHEGGFGFEQPPGQQVQSRYGNWPSLMPRPRPAEAPQFPMPQPRPPEAPQFPMPQPRPPEAPQPEQYGPPNPDTPTPVKTVPAGPAPSGDVTRSAAPPSTSAPPSTAPGQQRPQNPIQAIFHALGIPPEIATRLAGVVRQVGQNYSGGPLPGRQIPSSPQQTARREEQPTIPGMPEAPGAPGDAQKFIMDRGGKPAGEGAPNLNPEFADRVKKAAEAYEAETGRRAEFTDMGRSHEEQAKDYAEYRRTGQGLAAPPGHSRHEKGNAVDVPAGDFQNWMHRNASKFGINDLKGHAGRVDRNHFQMDPNFAGGGAGQPRQAQTQAGGMNRGAYERMFSGSPLSGQYENIIRSAQVNGVPPSLMASIIAEETGFGRSRQARMLNNPAGVFGNGRYKQYASIEEGITDAGRVIGNIYRRGGGTIQGMGQIYAPPGARNDPHHTNVQWPGAVSRFQRMLSEMQLSGQ